MDLSGQMKVRLRLGKRKLNSSFSSNRLFFDSMIEMIFSDTSDLARKQEKTLDLWGYPIVR